MQGVAHEGSKRKKRPLPTSEFTGLRGFLRRPVE
jgi:hypothetical protein